MKGLSKQSGVQVLVVVDGLPAGGMERQIVELLRGVAQCEGIHTTLCVLSTGGSREQEAYECADEHLSIHGAANAGLNLLVKFPFIATEILCKCSRVSFDIVHTYGCYSDLLGAVLSKIFNASFVNGSIRAARPVLNWRDRISRFTFPYANRIIANSHAGLKAFGIQNKGFAIHNGVEQGRFSNVMPIQIKGSPVLCMVGNFTDKKDHEKLVRCIPALTKKFKTLRLIFVGRGKRMQKVMAYAVSLGCRQSIEFVDDCDHPEPYIAAADLCLLLSNVKVHGEGISNAIMEYMALGKAVIATDCGGNSELIINGKTGFLIDNEDFDQLISHIKQLLDDPTRIAQMGLAGKQRILDDFTIKKMVGEYVRLYRQLAKENVM